MTQRPAQSSSRSPSRSDPPRGAGSASPLVLYGVPPKMTRRFLAVVIASQGLVIFFGALVAHTLAAAEHHRSPVALLWIGIVLAILSILAAGTVRRPWGVTLGWLIQLATLASGVVVHTMYLVGVLFLALWITALYQGAKMDRLTARYVASHPVPPGESEPTGTR